MSEPDAAADPLAVAEKRIEALEAALSTAKTAAATAEREQGRLQGELTRTTDLWVAACRHQEQWNEAFAVNVEALRHTQEELAEARAAHAAIASSTSWRVIQSALTPYRWLRGRR